MVRGLSQPFQTLRSPLPYDARRPVDWDWLILIAGRLTLAGTILVLTLGFIRPWLIGG